MTQHSVMVVKRRGQRESERFSEDKLKKSIIAACLSVRGHEGSAELTAASIVQTVSQWLENKSEVTTADIKQITYDNLHIHHPDAAYYYQQHKHIL